MCLLICGTLYQITTINIHIFFLIFVLIENVQGDYIRLDCI